MTTLSTIEERERMVLGALMARWPEKDWVVEGTRRDVVYFWARGSEWECELSCDSGVWDPKVVQIAVQREVASLVRHGGEFV